jgi:cation diffusion facilitator CzcD-associated flavoprotein CzcO
MTTTQYQWAVIGAGPAGIAAVGRLLDHGVAGHQIIWLDEDFAAGDLGAKWRHVSSNTSVARFLEYLNGASSFRFAEAPPFALTELDPGQTCRLNLVADPLVWITGALLQQVGALKTTVSDLRLHNRQWTVATEAGEITAQNVILAIGATAKKLSYPGLTEIAVEDALNPDRLALLPLDGATVAVFGSSHSTMIALPNLLDTPVARIINFYRSPLRYAVEQDGWTLYDDIGLKGQAAHWAKANIDGVHPPRLERVCVHSNDFDEALSRCDHAVYTVGFERRMLPKTPQWEQLNHNPANGIIAPGLFGCGIAFPRQRQDPLGFSQHRVGLHKFMADINEAMPVWLNYGT